ncbi:MAG: tripartite tricarboxylate transporter permease, partial [Candidatus Puniceispirillum sp.]
ISDEPVLAYSIYIAFFLASFIMLGMQSIVLRVFVLVTRIKAYVLATIILTFATIGVFALHNYVEDILTFFLLGMLCVKMRQVGFPLAPMLLGVHDGWCVPNQPRGARNIREWLHAFACSGQGSQHRKLIPITGCIRTQCYALSYTDAAAITEI